METTGSIVGIQKRIVDRKRERITGRDKIETRGKNRTKQEKERERKRKQTNSFFYIFLVII